MIPKPGRRNRRFFDCFDMTERQAFFLVSLIVCACLACATASGCSPKPEPGEPDEDPDAPIECEHQWAKIGESIGTCIVAGYDEYRCAICGATERRPKKARAPHNYVKHECIVCHAREPGAENYETGAATARLYLVSSAVDGSQPEYVMLVEGSGATADYSGDAPWKAHASEIVGLEVLRGVTRIGDGFLTGANRLSSIVLADTAKEIGDGAFEGCVELEEIAGHGAAGDEAGEPARVEAIGERAFAGCEKLRFVRMPELCAIGMRAFAGCAGILRLELGLPIVKTGPEIAKPHLGYAFGEGGSGKQKVGDLTFDTPDMLARVWLHGSGPIPAGAFEGCSTIREALLLGGITEIGEAAFKDMPSLEEARFGAALDDTLKTIGAEAFAGDRSLGRKAVEGEDAGQTQTKEFEFLTLKLPKALETLGARAFQGCDNLTVADFDPDCALKTLSAGVFRDSGVERLALPTGLTGIVGESALPSRLKELRIGPNAERIDARAFDNCSSIDAAYVESVDIACELYKTAMLDANALFRKCKPEKIYVSEAAHENATAQLGDRKNALDACYELDKMPEGGYYLWEY